MKKILPCGLCAAAPLLKNMSNEDNSKQSGSEKVLIRPSELPIYSPDTCTRKKSCEKKECEPSYLEQGFGSIRKSLKGVISQYETISDSVNNTINTGKEHSELFVDYIRDGETPWPRVGAIAAGGLVGLLLGIRGGKFKKIIYTSTGVLSAAAFCYPERAHDGLELAKHYTDIGYNFVYGVKPGDEEQLEIQWPEVPTSFSELGDLVIEFGSNTFETVGNLVSKTVDFVQEKESKPDDPSKPKTS
ncbi:MICOS complex subunit MIC27 [Leptopilina heterotoma]|uniref:MICOS complex subunit MIC27 n=1 Tax=Leptopilina heterotoma TaxID=63436 RepID=UPI001CA8BEB5|nr:MICOS complex subunit MIC27 [Leptopilina heterotoma]XP_043477091.1 MICOS complex subunit MIC27 [Leptopilina heterotoma]